MKKYVFMHVDAIPEGKTFEEITDKEIIEMINDDDLYFWVYDSFEDYINDFNNENAPNIDFCFGRAIDFDVNIEHGELYDKICKTLTWYEHPEEYPFDDKSMINDELYHVLVKVQNELF